MKDSGVKILLTGVVVLLASPVLGQAARTGVSAPDETAIQNSVMQPSTEAGKARESAKPSAAIAASSEAAVATPQYVDVPVVKAKPSAAVTETAPAGDASETTLAVRGAEKAEAARNMDGEIVTSVESKPNELSEGTLLKVRMKEDISTETTPRGTSFSGEVTEAVEHDGRVIVPVGAVVQGVVTQVHGGRRISGAALLHLEARTVTLPDGTHYVIHAQVIDTEQGGRARVDSEGSIVRKSQGKETLAAMSLGAAGAGSAGGMIAGVPGALVGAGVGAGVGTVLWLKQDRQAELKKDTVVIFSLTVPLVTTPLSAAVAGPESMGGGR